MAMCFCEPVSPEAVEKQIEELKRAAGWYDKEIYFTDIRPTECLRGGHMWVEDGEIHFTLEFDLGPRDCAEDLLRELLPIIQKHSAQWT